MNSGSAGFGYLESKTMQDRIRRDSNKAKKKHSDAGSFGRYASSSKKASNSEAMSQGGVVRMQSVTSDDMSVEMAGLSGHDIDSQSGQIQHIDDFSDRSPQPEDYRKEMDPQAAQGYNPTTIITDFASPRQVTSQVKGVVVPMTPIPEDDENHRDTLGADHSGFTEE